jgi:pimeloyl-ACP methyl ester carboxylesterase
MSRVKANNIEIEYDTFGNPSDKPLLTIMGLGSQMIMWDERLCEMLVKKGFYVIRFDNRDVGLSTKFDELGVPNMKKVLFKLLRGKPVESSYSLDDMADDAAGLLDALKIGKAHICGASMGAAVAQIMAYRHPDRVLSLVSIMGSSGNPTLPQPTREAANVLIKPLPDKRDAYIKESIKRWKVLSGSGFPYDEDFVRARSTRAYDRSFYPQGSTRQLLATLASGDRREKMSTIKVPTLVIHGSEDPLVSVESGKETASIIPNSELLIIEGMGHNLPIEAWPQIVEAIAKNSQKAGI